MILNYSNRVDDVLTDATSVALGDPAGAFGVRRTDTGEVIVAAGTAMARTGTGLYTYTVTEPVAGLRYEYWVEVVYLGETFRVQHFSNGTDAEDQSIYLSVDSARALAATLPGMTTLLAKDDATLGSMILAASIDIDMAMRYQGRKYDLGEGSISGTVGVEQEREFPRIVDSAAAIGGQSRAAGGWGAGAIGPGYWPLAIGNYVWDWDPDANAGKGGPVVPQLVKVATLYQMAWLLNPANGERMAAIQAGLASQSTASLSETYRSAAELAAMAGGGALDARAARIMAKYRLRSGGLL